LLEFLRAANEQIETGRRIHAVSKEADIRTERALVLYLSPSTKKGIHGKAFWKHKKLGYNIPEDISNEEFDRMLRDEANDLENWDLHTVIGYRPNRALMYP